MWDFRIINSWYLGILNVWFNVFYYARYVDQNFESLLNIKSYDEKDKKSLNLKEVKTKWRRHSNLYDVEN